jgi:hypothetical protein
MSEATAVTSVDPILSDQHQRMLEIESAITAEVIQARSYRTIENPEELLSLGFQPYQAITPGLLVPLYDMWGSVSSYQYRPDNPRKNAESKLIKYETREGYSRSWMPTPSSVRGCGIPRSP